MRAVREAAMALSTAPQDTEAQISPQEPHARLCLRPSPGQLPWVKNS